MHLTKPLICHYVAWTLRLWLRANYGGVMWIQLMFRAAEKGYRERYLFKEIERLEALILSDELRGELKEKNEIYEVINSHKESLSQLWNLENAEIRKDISELKWLLRGMLITLVFIAYYQVA